MSAYVGVEIELGVVRDVHLTANDRLIRFRQKEFYARVGFEDTEYDREMAESEGTTFYLATFERLNVVDDEVDVESKVWLPSDQRKAKLEGWWLFNEKEVTNIRRFVKAHKFESDAKAMSWVLARARGGNKLAQKATAIYKSRISKGGPARENTNGSRNTGRRREKVK